MRPTIGSRRADEFEALLSGSTDRPRSQDDDRLLALVAQMRSLPEVAARPAFVADLRTQLVAAAEREPARAEAELALRLTPTQRRGSRERRLAAIVGGFAVVSATGSMAVASQGALPGDVLYPVKRAIENAQTNLQTDGGSRADSLIGHARARLDEVTELVARDAGAGRVNEGLQDFTDQLEQARDLALDDYATSGDGDRVAELRGFAAEAMDVLAAVGPKVPSGSRPILVTATQTVRQVDAAAWEACPECADGSVLEMPDWALLRLSKVLDGAVPDTATVDPGTPVPSTAVLPPVPSGAPVPAPTGDALPLPLPSSSPAPAGPVGGVVGDTVRKLSDTLGGITGQTTPSPAPTPSSSPSPGDDTLLGGLLGGLLGN